jgi:hypothetical protein
MSGALKAIGVLLIISCLYAGYSFIQQIDWTSYEIAKSVYKGLSTNPVAKEQYLIAQNMVNSQLSVGITIILSGVISGLLLFSIAQIIDYLKEISAKLSKAVKQRTES